MATLGLDMERGLFLGIDFGTTNSVVSIYDFAGGVAETIPIDGAQIFPTAIQFDTDLEEPDKLLRIFGAQAKEAAIIYPESTVLSIKRLLGTDEKVTVTVDDAKYDFKPEQIAGEILGYLKQKADEYVQDELGISGEFSGCVISVPANSTDKQKKATKDAAVLAGFDEGSVFLRLEPAAAAISYAVGEKKDKKVLVYDFGGGTFDACLLEIKLDTENEPNIAILATSGNNNLGGNDVDKIILDIIYEEFKKATGGDIDLFDLDADDGVAKRQKKIAQVRMLQMATQAKERLSSSKTTKIVLAPLIQEPKIVNINIEITREDFLGHRRVNQLGDSDEVFAMFEGKSCEDLLLQTTKCVKDCLDIAQIDAGSVDEVFLVGGSSSVFRVPELIAETLGKEPFKSKISPALSISQGAACYCNMVMMPTVKGPTVTEKTVHPLGLEIAGRRFMQIIPAGETIPKSGLIVEAKEPLLTNFDNVASMAIIVYESTLPTEDNVSVNQEGMKRLAGTSLRGIPQAKRGEEKVKVIFTVSQENMLKVTAQSMSESGVLTELAVDALY